MGTRPQHNPAYQRLCKLLRKQRLASGLTLRALAAKLKRPHSYVYKVEIGERRIDPVEYVAWFRACGIDAAEAFGDLEKATGGR